MKGKFLIPIISIKLVLAALSIHWIIVSGSVVFGLLIFSLAMIGFGFNTSKLIDYNHIPKKPALNYE